MEVMTVLAEKDYQLNGLTEGKKVLERAIKQMESKSYEVEKVNKELLGQNDGLKDVARAAEQKLHQTHQQYIITKNQLEDSRNTIEVMKSEIISNDKAFK